ncbi:MAG: hypothetical protein FWG18_01980 [Alphaproteobacteria bacterium]|nr:hypothetical protein [Alphaproteobacteria bacterium]
MRFNGTFAKYAAMILLYMGYGFGSKALAQENAAPIDSTTTKNINKNAFSWNASADLITYAESTNAFGNANKEWTPVLGLVPDLNISANFGGKGRIFGQTNYFIQNWDTPEKFVIIPFSMSVGAELKTRAGELGVRVGHITPHGGFCLEAGWDDITSATASFYSAVYLNTVGNFPKMAALSLKNKFATFVLSYVEFDNDNPGFNFNQTNPGVAGAIVKSFKNGLKVKLSGASIYPTAGGHKNVGNLHMTYNPKNGKWEFLGNVVGANLGTKNTAKPKLGIAAGQRYNIKEKGITLQLTEIWQRDGVWYCGLTAGLKNGLNVSIGAAGNDPRAQFQTEGGAKNSFIMFGLGHFGVFQLVK